MALKVTVAEDNLVPRIL